MLEIIESFDKLRRYNIFQKTPQLKAFIEPINFQAYQRILVELNQSSFDIGLIMVFPSNKKKIVTVGPAKRQKNRQKSSHEVNGLDIISSNKAFHNGEKVKRKELLLLASQEQVCLDGDYYGLSLASSLNNELSFIHPTLGFVETSDYLLPVALPQPLADKNEDFDQCNRQTADSKNVYLKKLEQPMNFWTNSVCESCFTRMDCSNPSVITPNLLENLMAFLGNILAVCLTLGQAAVIHSYIAMSQSGHQCVYRT